MYEKANSIINIVDCMRAYMIIFLALAFVVECRTGKIG